jgi:MYXO-CTERM domain-containing protein
VHFTIRNSGTVEHNFTVELPEGNIEQTLFSTNLKPGETRTADFTFPRSGKWEMYCPVDKHEELGMKGEITVATTAAAGAAAPAQAPVVQPSRLPRTGDGPGLPWAIPAIGLLLLAGGLLVRRRAQPR